MKSSVKESYTHKENLKYAYYTVVIGCCFSEEGLRCECGEISWNVPAASSGMDSEQTVANDLVRKRAKQ